MVTGFSATTVSVCLEITSDLAIGGFLFDDESAPSFWEHPVISNTRQPEIPETKTLGIKDARGLV
jgi:hypothetical protein